LTHTLSLTDSNVVTEADPLIPPLTSKAKFNIHTIKRDLRILTETSLYYAEIEISGGANRVTTVDVEDFSLPDAVLQVWNNTRSRKKAPQMMVFEKLAIALPSSAVRQLTEKRRLIYKDHTVYLQIYRTIPGSYLEGFMSAFSELQTYSNSLMQSVLENHTEAKARFLHDEIRPLLAAGHFNDEETQRKLALYANRFPKLEQIQLRFGVQMKGPFRMQTWREALAEDTEGQQLLAERDRIEADLAQSRAETIVADQQIWMADQERRAFQSAHNYQQQQIRSAIALPSTESKVSEVQHQVLNLLYRNLQRLSEKDYQPGKLPSRLKEHLEALAESASVLSQTDASLAQVVAGLTQVNATARTPQSEQDTLRGQVDDLLRQLESRLRPPELEIVEDLGNDDRATWLKFA
jgi:hypothetical protein